jgi:Holliday junction resolvase
MRALRRDLMPELRREGFTILRITGERLSGANPGRIVDLILTLPESL